MNCSADNLDAYILLLQHLLTIPEQKKLLAKLSPRQIKRGKLVGKKIQTILEGEIS
jgi:hypothetical protein